ncbi:MAG: NuoM family protein, partial [Burkholderiales bacterium]
MMMHSLLSLTIWTPIVTGILVLLVARQDNLARGFALIGSIISLIFSILVFFHFDGSYSGVQFEESRPWIISLSLNYHLGIDGISLPFLVLNNFITLLVVLAGFKVIKYKVALYNSMFLMTAGFISGAFCAINAILFYVFFEAMLIPLYLIIGVWGGPNRAVAAIKFFLYTFFGSLMMLIAFIYLYFVSGKTFNIFTYYHTQL